MDKKSQFPDGSRERVDHVYQLLENVSDDQVHMRFHTTDKHKNREWVTKDKIVNACQLLENAVSLLD